MGRRATKDRYFDVDLTELPQDLRWREWMGRVEAVIFASPRPVMRETLSRVVGPGCNIDALIDDIRMELKGRPYDLVSVAGGWQHRTRAVFAGAIRSAAGVEEKPIRLSQSEHLALTVIAYFQPIARSELSQIIGREISRDVVARLRDTGLVGNGPRSPRAGAPMTYVTTATFLQHFGFSSLRDLPEMARLEEEGLLTKEALLSGEITAAFGINPEPDDTTEANEPNELFCHP